MTTYAFRDVAQCDFQIVVKNGHLITIWWSNMTTL